MSGTVPGAVPAPLPQRDETTRLRLNGRPSYPSSCVGRTGPDGSPTGTMPDTVHVINGPNLNLLGTREPEKYGRATLADVEKLVRDKAASFGWTVEVRPSNHGGER